MTPFRVAFFVSVVGMALAVSYFFILQPGSPSSITLKNEGESASFIDSIKDSTRLFAKNVLNIPSPDSDRVDPLIAASTSNLTDYFVEIITNQIKEKNSAGLTKKEDGSPAILAPSDEALAQQIEELLKNEPLPSSTDGPIYHPRVQETKLKISNDTSPSAQLNYVRSFVNLTRDLSGKHPLDIEAIIKKIESEKDGTPARQAAAIQEEIAARYAELVVPENWTAFAKAVLSHYFAAHDVWQGIANFQNDPLQAVLSLQELELIQKSELGIIVLLEQEVSRNGLIYDPANE